MISPLSSPYSHSLSKVRERLLRTPWQWAFLARFFHFLAQQVQGHVATQGYPPELPILKKEKNHLAWPVLPDDFKSETFNIVFVHLFGRCALAFCPLLQRRHSIKGSLDRHTSTYLPNSGETPSRDKASAITSKHKLSMSVQWQGLNSTAFVRAKGSFLRRKKKSSPYGPYFFGTFQTLAVVRKPATSLGSIKSHIPSQHGPSYIFCTILAQTTVAAIQEEQRLTQKTCEAHASDLWTQNFHIDGFQTL